MMNATDFRLMRLTSTVIYALLAAACDPELPQLSQILDVEFDPRYEQIRTESRYLTMRDGVRLAVDVTRPYPLQRGVQIPAIVAMTRYWRAEQGEDLDWRVRTAAQAGYAFVYVDERGTGASFGTWPHPWSETSLADFHEVVDWVVQQQWSNGKVGAWGFSYLGMAAQLLPATAHPAVTAVVPAFTQYDVYTDIAFPGGVFSEWFVGSWSATNARLDANDWPGDPNRSVKRVDSDYNGSLLAAAVADHVQNGSVYQAFRSVTYRDQLSSLGITLDDISAHEYRDALEASGVAVYGWGSWMDHGTAHATITRFITLSNSQRAVIGPWTHVGWAHASPYRAPGTPPEPSEAQQWAETLHFLDKYVKHAESAGAEKVLYYYTMGAEEWRSTDTWPVPSATPTTWYFGQGGSLSEAPPTDAAGSDSYAVDFSATTGEHTRWHTAMDGPVIYPDRHDEDTKLLTYTSDPFAEDIEITGYPVVTLFASSTHTDGAFFAYLEDVDAAGRVTYITEGQLRALHRKVATEEAPYELMIPYHSFEQKDAELLVPGQIAELTFGLLPTSVLIRAGHRIRVAIAGHDNGLFARIPESGDPVIQVERNSTFPSRIELPVVRVSENP